MEKIGKQSKEKDSSYANKLPAEIVGRFLQNLTVWDRLKSERVSPRWKNSLEKWGWTEQQKLDRDVVFEGARWRNVVRFWGNMEEGSCHLASLIYCCAPWLHELDLRTFGAENTERFLPQILESLHSLKKLEKLNIGWLHLEDFVDHFPQNIRELKTSGRFEIDTLKALSNRCPELEEVPFQNLENQNDQEGEAVIELAGMFLRQKKLDFRYFHLPSEKQGALTSFGQLKALEELDLWHCLCLDGESFQAIVEGCQRLRSLSFNTHQLTEGELFQLAQIQNLTVLEVRDRKGNFSDAVLKTIAQRGKLKKLRVYCAESSASLTDTSVVYLINRCKSLISLKFYFCPQITERSLEAVVAEVRQRHGTAPGTLPSGNEDPGLFYLYVLLDGNRVQEMIGDNPWLRFGVVDHRTII